MVGALSAVAGIGGGVLLVPFLYLIYSGAPAPLSAQTVVAHATSLGVSFVASSFGAWRYARARAIAWRPAALYAGPAVLAAFAMARVLTRVHAAPWIRALFGAFLLVSAWDMVRRARHHGRTPVPAPHPPHAWIWLVPVGIFGGAASALLGIGGGLIAVPALFYVGRLPVQTVAPTALAGVCVTTLSGGLGYLTAGPGPAISPMMAGFMDLRMLLPLALGAILTVPLGVRFNRRSSPPTLYWLFAGVFAAIGALLIVHWIRG